MAASRPDAGKTSVCLALVSHFAKVLPNGIRGVGYMKAVGDRPVRVSVSSSGRGGVGARGGGGGGDDGDGDGDGGGDEVVVAVVDGDVELLRSHFGMTHLDRADMSPSSSVLSSSSSASGASSGGGGRDDYARGYLDGDVGRDDLLEGVRRAYGNLRRCTAAATTTGGTTRTINDDDDDDESVIIVEGTGHAGAGSVIGAGNARIAAGLGASVILVADGGGGGGGGGGVGEAFDELHANRSLFLVSGY